VAPTRDLKTAQFSKTIDVPADAALADARSLSQGDG
jgi:hypothetical protein